MEQIPSIIHESWHPYFKPLFNNPKMINLKNVFLPFSPFYPEAKNIFRVFEMPLHDIKVVILGQDPYSKGEAIGYSFAVGASTPIPKSLEIIRKELIREEISNSHYTAFNWRELEHWRDQGVFLLNTALTVEHKSPGSHVGVWRWFSEAVVSIIAAENSCIWMLWGAKAQAFGSIVERYPGNHILKAPHPAAEAYAGNRDKFTGCNHFKLCNELLEKTGKLIINW